MKVTAEDELIGLEKDWAQAFVTNDAEAIGRYMADDWMIVGPDGGVLERPTFLELVRSGMLSHEAMEFEDIKARVYGDTAVLTAQATSKGRFGREAFSERERLSDVFVKQNGQWKCVLTHLTRIANRSAVRQAGAATVTAG